MRRWSANSSLHHSVILLLLVSWPALHGSHAQGGDDASWLNPWPTCDDDDGANQLASVYVPRLLAQSPDSYGQPTPLSPVNDPLVIQAPFGSAPTVLEEQAAADDDVTVSGLAVQFVTALYDDARMFYSIESLATLSAGVGIAALMANTHFDQDLQDRWQHGARYDETNAASKIVKMSGEGQYLLGLYAAAVLADAAIPDDWSGSVLWTWGSRSARASLVGTPALLILQHALGGSRPKDRNLGIGDSHWRFWADDNAVSGHTFMGAIPLLTAAMMVDEPVFKIVCIGTSLAIGWSRVNDNHHYPSQVILGWWMAMLASTAVHCADEPLPGLHLAPLDAPEGFGLALEWTH